MGVEFRQDPKGLLKIWRRPERNRKYVIPADVAEGVKGGNFSAAHVLDLESFEQVAVWHGLEEPYQFGRILFNMGEFYNCALLAPERNNNGISVIDYLRTNSYPRLYRMQKFDYQVMDETERLGWMTNAHTRPLIIDALKESVRSNSIVLNDADTLAELRTFIRNQKTGKIEAAGNGQGTQIRGNHKAHAPGPKKLILLLPYVIVARICAGFLVTWDNGGLWRRSS